MPNKSDLPFLWGAATSSHQVEGNNSANDWWAWEQAGRVREASGLACDHYRLFHEDIELIAHLGHNAHRFSIEWSRLEPQENIWNDEAFHHYEEVLKELRARNIEPIVTLHHFTNPEWLAKLGGWQNEKIIYYFTRYVDRVIRAFGKYVRFWVTINEPLIYLYFSFYEGTWPPGVKSYAESLKVFRHQLLAHIAAYQQIHRYYESELGKPVWISMAQHMSSFMPCRPGSFLDRVTVFLRSYFFNYLVAESLLSGFLFFPGAFCEFLPGKSTLDFIGVNYYTREFIKFAGFNSGQGHSLGEMCEKGHHRDQVKGMNQMGWEIYPEGLYQILKRVGRYRLPVMILENGICAQDDEQRIAFIREHADAVGRAMREGVPVKGYFYWSLLDNFEWAHGFGPRFGIVEVDYKNQQRKIRKSAQVLTESCRNLLCQRKE